MIVGVPREIKEGENRVSLVPSGARALATRGHIVMVERGAGKGCGFSDREYEAAGARVASEAAEVWENAQLIVKVKEPLQDEYPFLRKGLTLFTFLHLAANIDLTGELMEKGVMAIGYETVCLADGSIPILVPMSEVAGCLAAQKGAYFLEAQYGGRGILLPGVCGAPPARVTVIGGGVVGTSACRVAEGMGAQVTVLDVSTKRLQYLQELFGGHVNTLLSGEGAIEERLIDSDLVIGAVLLPGRCAPHLISRDMVGKMPDGSVLVDVAIDQGGIAETSRPTTHKDPVFVELGVVHCCITNLPAAVPRSSTLALTASTLPYVLALTDKGVKRAIEEDASLSNGLNIKGGEIVHPGVRESWAEKKGRKVS